MPSKYSSTHINVILGDLKDLEIIQSIQSCRKLYYKTVGSMGRIKDRYIKNLANETQWGN